MRSKNFSILNNSIARRIISSDVELITADKKPRSHVLFTEGAAAVHAILKCVLNTLSVWDLVEGIGVLNHGTHNFCIGWAFYFEENHFQTESDNIKIPVIK